MRRRRRRLPVRPGRRQGRPAGVPDRLGVLAVRRSRRGRSARPAGSRRITSAGPSVLHLEAEAHPRREFGEICQVSRPLRGGIARAHLLHPALGVGHGARRLGVLPAAGRRWPPARSPSGRRRPRPGSRRPAGRRALRRAARRCRAGPRRARSPTLILFVGQQPRHVAVARRRGRAGRRTTPSRASSTPPRRRPAGSPGTTPGSRPCPAAPACWPSRAAPAASSRAPRRRGQQAPVVAARRAPR